jgi:hypothetical protein
MKRRFRVFAMEALVASLAACALGLMARGQGPAKGHDIGVSPTLILKGSLEPRLSSNITHIKFSPDGNYVLAQDSSSIFVLTRQPLAQRFQIDALAAGTAQFTPDSSEVVFSTGGLRPSVERRSVTSGKPTSKHEIPLVGACVESLLSPDGRSLACFSVHTDSTPRLRSFIEPFGPPLDLDFDACEHQYGRGCFKN